MDTCSVFFFNDTATTEIYTLSLHDALPISRSPPSRGASAAGRRGLPPAAPRGRSSRSTARRSEEHTSELQSRLHLVCRLLLEKKKCRHLSHGVHRRCVVGSPRTLPMTTSVR